MDYLYCVQMYLPLRDKDGQPINTEMFNAMADEIVEKFGGLTMTPLLGNPVYDGFWKSPRTKKMVRDKNSVFTIFVPQEEGSVEFFRDGKKKWQTSLNYEELLIIVHQVQAL